MTIKELLECKLINLNNTFNELIIDNREENNTVADTSISATAIIEDKSTNDDINDNSTSISKEVPIKDKEVRCCRCGRVLKDEQSKLLKFGAVCYKHNQEKRNKQINLLKLKGFTIIKNKGGGED